MHLTNYAINKQNDNFEANDNEDNADCGHKRSVSSVLKHIEDNYPGHSVEGMWEQIEDIANKTIISAQAHLTHSFRSIQPEDLENSMCFEILGFDIFIDEKIKPWLIEVNSLASFATDSPLDKKVKYDLIYETIRLLNLNNKRKKKAKRIRQEQFQARQQHKNQDINKQNREAKRRQLQRERD